MALPRINDKPKYDVVIPSTQKKVKFRPYLVKEEKVLLLAMESGDLGQMLTAVADTVLACIVDPVDPKALTTFDIEYLFLKIRSKSVGEHTKVGIACTKCSVHNEIDINIDDIKVEVKEKSEKKIDLNGEVFIKMKWPSFQVLTSDSELLDEKVSDTEKSFLVVMQCMDSIQTEDETWLIKDTPKKEVLEFLESLTNEQYNQIKDYIESIPELAHTIEFDCVNCGTHNKESIKGIRSFF